MSGSSELFEAYYEGQLDEKQIVIHSGSGGAGLRGLSES